MPRERHFNDVGGAFFVSPLNGHPVYEVNPRASTAHCVQLIQPERLAHSWHVNQISLPS